MTAQAQQNDSRAASQRWRMPEIVAAAIALALAIPAMLFFFQAIGDGSVRSKRAPLEAMLGTKEYEALTNGETLPEHYLGDNRSAPDFTLRDQHGRPWRLSDHRGKVVVLNFWTITCPPCVEEMPSLDELARIVQTRGDIEVVAVTIDKNWKDVASIFPPKTPLKVLFDPDRKVVTAAYGTRVFPETWIIDPQGIIRVRIDGARPWSSPIALDLFKSYL